MPVEWRVAGWTGGPGARTSTLSKDLPWESRRHQAASGEGNECRVCIDVDVDVYEGVMVWFGSWCK